MLERETPYIIIGLFISFMIKGYIYNEFEWDDPAAPSVIFFMMLLVFSSMIIGRHYGLIIGLLALTWPNLLELANILYGKITKEYSSLKIIPIIGMIFAEFIFAIYLTF
jgi:hypothetical protein